MNIIIRTSTVRARGRGDIDITIKSADEIGKILAPTWALVGGHKHQADPDDERWQQYVPLTDEQYTEQYLALLRERYRCNAGAFLTILNRGEITLCCYCPPGRFCHRHIAADVLEKIAVYHGYTVQRVLEV